MFEAVRNLFPGFPCRVVVRFQVQAFSDSAYEGLPVGFAIIKKQALPPLCPIVVKDLLFSVEFFYDFFTAWRVALMRSWSFLLPVEGEAGA